MNNVNFGVSVVDSFPTLEISASKNYLELSNFVNGIRFMPKDTPLTPTFMSSFYSKVILEINLLFVQISF